MTHPLVIIISSMLVGLAVLIGLTAAINRVDDWLRQHEAAISLKRWPPTVKDLGNNIIEVAVFGNARWDQIPALMLGGFFVVAILVSFPVPGQTGLFVLMKVGFLSLFFLASLISALWMRSRHTRYRIDLTSGQVQRQSKLFGWPDKVKNYLLKLPVQAGFDCQPKDDDRKDATMKYATCWLLKDNRKLVIVHKSQEEAEQFRADLAAHGCPTPAPLSATN
ncbi:MAG: hypothetical protein KDI79_29405 [Anaerolineae bacterium]|nr:hypothetical protein [Anaerolineae bacterium]